MISNCVIINILNFHLALSINVYLDANSFLREIYWAPFVSIVRWNRQIGQSVSGAPRLVPEFSQERSPGGPGTRGWRVERYHISVAPPRLPEICGFPQTTAPSHYLRCSLLPLRWERKRKGGERKKKKTVINRSAIREKSQETRDDERRWPLDSSIYLPIPIYLWSSKDALSGSREILWPFHRLSRGIRRPVPVEVHLLSFLSPKEEIPPTQSDSKGAGSPRRLPLFILLPPKEWEN